MDHTNQDVVGENCVVNDAGELVFTDEDKMKAWVTHYARLLNIEFQCQSKELPEVPPSGQVGPPSSMFVTLIHEAPSQQDATRLLAHMAT